MMEVSGESEPVRVRAHVYHRDMHSLRELKKLLIRVCHLLAEKDYVSAMDGNVTARLPDGTFLSTPTMIHKAFITEEDLIIVDAQGQKLQGPPTRHPTSELFMHLACYQARPEMNAVVHAHPPTAIAFTIAGESLAHCVLPEVVLTLGRIPTAPYQTTGTRELAGVVGNLARTHDAILMDRHGVIALGTDLIDAFGKLEKVEHTAMITHKARALGKVLELDCNEVDRLRQLGQKYSSNGQLPPICESCGGCPSRAPWQEAPAFRVGRLTTEGDKTTSVGKSPPLAPGQELERLVTEEVMRVLAGRQRTT